MQQTSLQQFFTKKAKKEETPEKKVNFIPEPLSRLPLAKDDDLEVFYAEKWLDPEHTENMFRLLLRKIPWASSSILPNAFSVNETKREHVVYGDPNEEHPSWQPWFEELSVLRSLVEEVTKSKFDMVLVNFYPTGKSGLGHHMDKEERGKETPIASVSFGATRTFELLPNQFFYKEKSEKWIQKNTLRLSLKAGALLVMGKNCQSRYLHAVLPDKDVYSPRINLTFRSSLGYIDSENL